MGRTVVGHGRIGGDALRIQHGRRVVHPGHLVLPHGFRIGSRDRGVHRDRAESGAPPAIGVYRVHGGGPGRRLDIPGRHRVNRVAAAADRLRVERRAVVILEGHGVGVQDLPVGHGQIRERRLDARQLRRCQGGDMAASGQDKARRVVAVGVDAGEADKAQHHIRVRVVPVHVDQSAGGKVRCRGHDGVTVHIGAVLDPDTGQARRGAGQGRKPHQAPGRQGEDRRKDRRLHDGAHGEGHARHAGVGDIQLFQAGKAGQVQRLHQVRGSPQVDVLQHRIVAEGDRRQPVVGVARLPAAKLQPGKPDRAVQRRPAGVQAGEARETGDIGGAVDVGLRVVQGRGGGDRRRRAAASPHLHRAGVAVLDRDVHIAVGRDRHVAGWRDAAVAVRDRAAELDPGRGRQGGRILGGHVDFLVGLKLPPLVLLCAVKHLKVGGFAGRQIRGDVLRPHIFVDQGLRAGRLVVLELPEDAARAPRARALPALEHGGELRRHVVPDHAPQRGPAGIEHRGAVHAVRVLQTVGEGQAAGVIVAVRRVVVVVLGEVPEILFGVAVVLVGDKAVFRPVIHHAVPLGEQVVVQQGIHGEVVPDLRPELGRPVGRGVVGVGGAVDGDGGSQGVARGLRGVHGHHPGKELLELGLGGGALAVAEFKAVAVVRAPPLVCQVIGLEKALGIVVVRDLDAALLRPLARVLAEYRPVLLGVVHIAAAIEDGLPGGDGVGADGDRPAAGIREEHRAGVPLHRIAHLGVCLTRRGKPRLIGVVVVRQEHVVRVLGGGHVELDVEVRYRDAVRGHGVGGQVLPLRVRPGTRPGHIDIQVQGREAVGQRGRALGFVRRSDRRPVVAGPAVPVDVLDLRCDGILLAGGQPVRGDADDPQVRVGVRQGVQIHRAARGEDVVPLVPVDHLVRVGAVRDEVVQDLIPGQAGIVHFQPVQPHVAVVGADLEGLRHALGPAVVGGVHLDARDHALHPEGGEPVVAGRFDVHVQLDLLALAVQGVHRLQGGFDGGRLGLDREADAVRGAVHELRVVVSHVGRLEDDLDLLAGVLGVVVEQGSIQADVGAPLHHKSGDAVAVLLEAAVHPVEIRGVGKRMVRAVPVLIAEVGGPGLVVRVPGGVDVHHGPRHLVDVVFQGGDRDRDRGRHAPGGQGQGVGARCHGPVGPILHRAVRRDDRIRGAVDGAGHRQGFVGGIVHHELDVFGGVLRDGDRGVLHGDHRRRRPAHGPDAGVGQHVRGNGDAVDRSGHPRPDGMGSVALGRDRDSHRAARCGDHAAVDARSVHRDVHGLVTGAGGNDAGRHRTAAIIGHVRQVPGQAKGRDRDLPGEAPAGAVAVLDGQPHGVRGPVREVGPDVEGIVTLGDALHRYAAAAHVPGRRAVARAVPGRAVRAGPARLDGIGRGRIHQRQRPGGHEVCDPHRGAGGRAAAPAAARGRELRAGQLVPLSVQQHEVVYGFVLLVLLHVHDETGHARVDLRAEADAGSSGVHQIQHVRFGIVLHVHLYAGEEFRQGHPAHDFLRLAVDGRLLRDHHIGALAQCGDLFFCEFYRCHLIPPCPGSWPPASRSGVPAPGSP